jgi:hypothetical protein
MERGNNYNKDSEYRSIKWVYGTKGDRAYELGQIVTAHIDDNGDRSFATIYSIDDTSYKVEDLYFIRRFSIRLINIAGDVFEWFVIENPVNITLQKAHENLTKI